MEANMQQISTLIDGIENAMDSARKAMFCEDYITAAQQFKVAAELSETLSIISQHFAE